MQEDNSAPIVNVFAENFTSASWLNHLPSESRAQEGAKMAERQKKPEATAKQRQRENEWEQSRESQQRQAQRVKDNKDEKWQMALNKVKQRAAQEHVVEAEWYDDTWWIKTQDAYRSVSRQYYCEACDKHLNDLTLEPHLESQKHKKCIAGLVSQDPSRQQFDMPLAWVAPPSCKERPYWWAEDYAKHRDLYPAPELLYLAYVPADEDNDDGTRWLKCLLCNKFVQDDVSHTGTVSALAGSNNHRKNLTNYCIPGSQWYEEHVVKVRNKWHPPNVPVPLNQPVVIPPPVHAPPPPLPRRSPEAMLVPHTSLVKHPTGLLPPPPLPARPSSPPNSQDDGLWVEEEC